MGKCTYCSLGRISPAAHLTCSLLWSDACFIPLGGRVIIKEESALEPFMGDCLWNGRLSHNHHSVHCLSKSWYTCELSSYGFVRKYFTESKVRHRSHS